jgi:hypothetical protein
MKPNCYECKWRGNVPGDAHSCCKNPKNKEILDDPLLSLMAILAGVRRYDPVNLDTGLKVKGNAHGIRNGWFNWPFNFDPVWLEECNGFENKEEK